MKKMLIFALLAIIAVQPGFGETANIQISDTLHIRGYADNAEGGIAILMRSGGEINQFEVNDKTEIEIDGKAGTISDLQKLDGKDVLMRAEKNVDSLVLKRVEIRSRIRVTWVEEFVAIRPNIDMELKNMPPEAKYEILIDDHGYVQGKTITWSGYITPTSDIKIVNANMTLDSLVSLSKTRRVDILLYGMGTLVEIGDYGFMAMVLEKAEIYIMRPEKIVEPAYVINY